MILYKQLDSTWVLISEFPTLMILISKSMRLLTMWNYIESIERRAIPGISWNYRLKGIVKVMAEYWWFSALELMVCLPVRVYFSLGVTAIGAVFEKTSTTRIKKSRIFIIKLLLFINDINVFIVLKKTTSFGQKNRKSFCGHVKHEFLSRLNWFQ